jgi:antitoxin CcdA
MRLSLDSVRSPRGTRKPTNVSIGQALLEEAKILNVNISQAAEAGLKAALAAKRAEIWLQENRLAIESSNAYVAQKGLPLAKYRGF